MHKLVHTIAVVAAAGLAGFAGTSALTAAPVAPQPGHLIGATPTAGMPIAVILIMKDAAAVRAEHDRRPP